VHISSDRLALYTTLLIAAVVVSISVRLNLFVAGGTDSSAYISAGDLWRRGELHRAVPLQSWASWPHAIHSGSPVGYRPGLVPGTEVPVYPLGFPLLIAAATSVGGALSAHLVAPVMAGVLVFCTFALARRVAGNLAGLIAALLIASSPIVLLHTVDTMSDVPATACWAAAWLLATRGMVSASVTAGCLTSMAILIRPNLAPLALVLACVVLAAAPRAVMARAISGFVFASAVGPLIVVWSQALLYGNPLAPGYVGWEAFYQLDHIRPNVRIYRQLLAMTHTLLPLAGLATVPIVFLDKPRAFLPQARIIALSAAAIVLTTLALYLPYLPFDNWPFLRFLLPGLVALFVLFASLIAHVTSLVWGHARWAACLVPCVALIVAAQGTPFVRYALQDWRAQTRVRLMGRYLNEALPSNAAVLSFVHSGAIAHYTDRAVVRLDLLEPATLDQVIDDLTRHHYRPVLVLDQALELDAFKQRFAGSRFGRLDWPPRAIFTSVTSIWYVDVADLRSHQEGTRWPVDVLN
jgi:hypothetical protein